jgi:hypothetical protein
MKTQDMTQRYRKFKRAWGMWYAFDTATGNSLSLKTRVKAEAVQKVNVMNETERQPSISLGLARVYLNATDPKLATRTWQEVMENIAAKKTDETRRRWDVAMKDRNFDCIRKLPVAETRPEHFDRALADGKVSSNVYLRRIHNHALGMEWLLKSVIPRLLWPKPVFKAKRAITAEEHAAIVTRELNAERRDSYELLWHTGASQTDAAYLLAEDVDWNSRTISYSRAKLKSRGGHWHQAGADSLRKGNRGHFETASVGWAALSIPSHRACWRPGDGVSSTLRRVGDFGRVPALVSVCVGGTGFEMRIPRAVRTAGVGAQFQGGASCLLETRRSHRSVAG